MGRHSADIHPIDDNTPFPTSPDWMSHLRIASWNVAARTRRIAEQVDAITTLAPDVLALQEVRRSAIPIWTDALRPAGLAHVISSDTLEAPDTGPRVYRLLIASRYPLVRLAALDAAPWPERVLRARVHSPGGDLTVTAAHLPLGGRHGLIKIETFEALRAAVRATPHPQVLCGDFNSPRAEHADGTVITFAQERDGRIIPRRGQRWDAGERDVLTGLAADADVIDVVRAVHGYATELHSWYSTSHGRRYGFRLDHMLASRCLAPLDAFYASELRERGLSDHAPVVADMKVGQE